MVQHADNVRSQGLADEQDELCRQCNRRISNIIEYDPGRTKQQKPKVIKKEIRQTLQQAVKEGVSFERMLLLMFYELRSLVNSYFYKSEKEDKQNLMQQLAIAGLKEEIYDLNLVWVLYSIDLWIQMQCGKEKITIVEIIQGFIRGVADRMIQYGNYAENDIGGILYLFSLFTTEQGEKGRRLKYREQIEKSFSENPNIIEFIFRFGLREISKEHKKLIKIQYLNSEEELTWKENLESLRDSEGSARFKVNIQNKEIQKYITKSFEKYGAGYAAYVEFQISRLLRNLLRAGDKNWRTVLKNRYRALLPISAEGDSVILENAMGICMIQQLTMYQKGKMVQIHAFVDFFGAKFELQFELNEYGDLIGIGLCEIDQAILRHIVILAYKNIVTGMDEQYEAELNNLRKTARTREVEDSAIFLPAYMKKRHQGITPSEQNYQHAEKAGYLREWMDGQNPDKESKMFVNTEAHPKGAEDLGLYKEEIIQVFSLSEVLKTAKEHKE